MITVNDMCPPGHTMIAYACVVATPPPGPPAPSPVDGLGGWAVGGFCLAAVLIAAGVAGVLFPKPRPGRWDR